MGLLLDDIRVCAWVYRMVERIESSDYASIELLVLNGAAASPSGSVLERMGRRVRNLVPFVATKLLDMAEERLVNRGSFLPDAFAQRDLSRLLPKVALLEVVPIRKQVSDYFSERDLEAIRGYGLDVLIRIGFRILRGGILHGARYGVWSYHHGDNMVNRGGPAGYWEAMERWPTTGSMLQILSEEMDNGTVLYRSWSCTQETLADNRNNLYWKTLSFIPRKLEQLHREGYDALMRQAQALTPERQLYSRRLYRVPTRGERTRLIGARVRERVRQKYANKLYFDQWFLLYHLGERGHDSMWRYRRLLPPKDRFWADPHVVYREGRYYLFIEEFLFAEQRGHISVMEMDEQGRHGEPVPILERPYHLSYPFVFEYQGHYYMVPESAENRTVDLYRCVEFPHRWEQCGTLLDGVHAVDATLHPHGGRWWMFVNMVENRGASSCDELFLFHADTPLGNDWTPHPLNPVISDARRARPAGRIFTENGRIYRPSQNCSVRYGYGFNINRILHLDEREYREELVSTATPEWEPGLLATHTYSRAHRLTVIDAQRRAVKEGVPGWLARD